MIAYLASTPQRTGRDELARLLWPDATDKVARANLRVVLNQVRAQLPDLLDADRDHVGIAAAHRGRIDLHQFEDAATRALSAVVAASGERGSLLAAAERAYGGVLLAGLSWPASPAYEEWLEVERERLAALAQRVGVARIEADLAEGATEDTLRRARRLAAADPLSEVVHALLLRSEASLGNREQALAAHDGWVRRLREQLDLDPSDEIGVLVDEIRAGGGRGAPLEAEGGGAVSAPRRTFVGRHHDLDVLSRTLASGCRLITITGPTGVGKSTLAWALSERVEATSTSPVVIADLQDTESHEEVLVRLATSFRDGPPDVLTLEALLARLAGRSALLVLDDADHAPGAAEVVAALHDRCPLLVLVVTARTALRLEVEHVHELPPFPAPQRGPHAARSPAVRLFLSAADRSGARIDRSAEQIADVAQVCRRVDGLPLAIELAAARLPVLGLAGLLEALSSDSDAYLGVLSPSRGTDRIGGRGMRAALRSATRDLDPPTIEMLAQLSVLRGSYDLSAIAAVCGSGDPYAVLDEVTELVGRHLLVRVPQPGGTVRFRQLVSTRAFGRQLVGADDRADLAARHADHFLAWPDRVLGDVDDEAVPDFVALARRFRADLPNLRAALRWGQDHGHDARVLGALARLGPWYREAGALAEGVAALDAALCVPATPETEVVRAECRVARASLRAELGMSGAGSSVRDDLEAGLPIVLRQSGTTQRANALGEAINAGIAIGDLPLSEKLARSLEELSGTPRWRLSSRVVMALASFPSDPAATAATLSEALPEARRIGHRRVELTIWYWLSTLPEEARIDVGSVPDLETLLAMSREAGDTRSDVWLMASLGAQALLDGDVEAAVGHLDAAMATTRRAHFWHGIVLCLLGTVAVAHARGDRDDAARLFGSVAGNLATARAYLGPLFARAYEPVLQDLERDDALAPQREAGQRLGFPLSVARAHRYLREARHRDRTVR